MGQVRTGAMLSFNSLEFSYQHENKGLDVATQIHDDPSTELFDQYISQDSSSSSDNVYEAVDFGGFEFGFGDQTTSSSSYVAAQPLSSLAFQQGRRLHSSSYDTFSTTRARDSFLPRRQHKSLYFEKPTVAISGKELLNLEGKSPLETPRQNSSLGSVPALPLRRKGRFTPESLRGQGNRITKPAGATTNEPANMMRPSYYHRQETPSYQEWTQRFEQISLQTPTSNLPLSPPASATFDTKPAPSGHKALNLRRREGFNHLQSAAQSYSVARNTIPSPQASPVPFIQQPSSETLAEHAIVPDLLQSPSWAHPTNHVDGFDFSIPPKDVQPDWTHTAPETCDAHYEHSSPVQSAPALPPIDTDFPNHGLMIDPYGHFITEDPSAGCFATPADSFQVPVNDTHPSSLPQEENTGRTSTPESRASACPSPPPPSSAKSPSRPRQRSKCHRRSKSSISTLKSPKSAGSLGFVNFTPSDSQKILTGVAPSGSSKTKARRELEAHEKKRKLSLAVEKVFRDAGGDSAKLKLAGLI